MSYGLDKTSHRIICDGNMNPLTVELPYKEYSALLVIVDAARRAQTELIEKRTPPGAYKSSLAAAIPPTPDEPQPPSVPTPPKSITGKPPSTARMRAEAMFDATPPRAAAPVVPAVTAEVVTVPPEPVAAPVAVKCAVHREQVFFPRVFKMPPPEGVAKRINEGFYFLRAWREEQGLTVIEMAELFGVSKNTISTHEQGYNIPSDKTLLKYADILGCDIRQLTVKKNTNTKSPRGIKRASPVFKSAPIETEYPDVVLGHLNDGKSPVMAWRLFRRMSLKDVAELYGSTVDNIKQLEGKDSPREKTREKLASVFRCKPVQLLKPEGFEPRRTNSNKVQAGEVSVQAAA